MPGVHKMKNTPSFKKIAINTWVSPNDPTIYGTMRLDMTHALKFIESQREKHEEKVTVTHLVAKAAAYALKKCPELNARIARRKIFIRDTVDVFLQVFLGKGEDLSGAKIENADQKKPHEISGDLRRKAELIRNREDPELAKIQKMLKFMPSWAVWLFFKLIVFLMYELNLDLSFLGMPKDPFGSVMVTSVGMFGIDVGYAPIVPYSRVPMLLLVGEVKDEPVAVDGRVEVRPTINLNGTFDHRLYTGVDVSRIAKYVREYMLDPFE